MAETNKSSPSLSPSDGDCAPLLNKPRSTSGSSSNSYLNDDPLLFDHTFAPSFMRIRDDDDDPLLGTDSTENYPEGGSDTDSERIPHEHYAVDHCHTDSEKRSNTARNQLIGVSVLCLLFMIGEIVGGLYANSLALLTDATHLASDLASFLISLFALWVSKKPATKRMSFGFHRAEIVGALISVLVIWVVTGILLYLAVERIIHRDYDIDADNMLITAGCGVAFNILMGVVLHSEMCVACRPSNVFGHGHSHGGHGHSHGGHGNNHESSNNYRHLHTAVAINNSSVAQSPSVAVVRPKKKNTKNIVIRAAIIHVLGDLVQSVGVLIAAYIIKYKPEYKLADPICTFLFSILVLFTTVTVLRDTFYVIMEAVPQGVDYTLIKAELESIEGVETAHSLHIWSLTLGKHALAVHLAIVNGADSEKILQIATGLLRTKHSMHQSTIQIEKFQHEVMTSCQQCIGPSS